MKMSITEFTVNQLEEEIERRKKADELANKPQVLDVIDWRAVKRMCMQEIDQLLAKGRG